MAAKSIGGTRKRIADLVILIVFAAFAVGYCLDAIRASTAILNLILVVPLTILVLVLCLAQFVLDFLRPAPEPGRATTEDDEDDSRLDGSVAEVLPVAGLFAGYVLLLPWLGFDVGTALFVGIFLWLQGERRIAWLAAYSIGFAFLLAFFFARMLPYPMPMLVLGAG